MLLCLVLSTLGSPAFTGGIRQPDINKPLTLVGRDITTQLQPEGHDQFVHGLLNFFNHELVFVENDLILDFQPSTGEWALRKLYRDCGVGCAIIAEVPERSGVWPDRKFHKLVFMGCHATTGHGHMLQVDPSSANYSVYLFDHSQPDPMTTLLAHHRRIEMTQFRVTYVGKDEIALYDANTNHFKVYLVEPRLPMYDDEDPIGPFEPLASGNCSLHEQLVYLGKNHLLDYSSSTGEFVVLAYDRGATSDEVPFKPIGVSGFLEKYLQLTYLGENQVLAYNPDTGKFKSFELQEDLHLKSGVTKEGIYFGFGSILNDELCTNQKQCRDCIAKDGCGWCMTSETCFRGSLNGPCTTNCTTWELHLCPGEPCRSHKSCSSCLTDPFCGWCADGSHCAEGTLAGPLFGSCDFSKVVCPVFVAEEIHKEECKEEIE
jgi:hypothetical protein